VNWNDAARTLSFSARQGTYPNMPPQTTFHIVVVRPTHGIGEADTTAADQNVTYSGAPLTATLK
jgi:alpha-D-xyloside xylohydrolase